MKRIVVFSLFLTLMVSMAAPAFAAGGLDAKDQIVLWGRAHVPAGELVHHVVIFHGPATIEGEVTGSVVVFDGAVTVSGTVRHHVISFRGRVTIASGGRVGEDIFSRSTPTVASGATVGGDLEHLDVPESFAWFRLGIWIATAISVLALGMLMVLFVPRAFDAAHAAGRSATGPAIGWGVALFVGLPFAAILAIATAVGIPLGFLLLLALMFVYMVGYTTGAWILGRALVTPPRGRAIAFTAGWAIISAAGLIPYAGVAVAFATAVFGLGALAVATWRARGSRAEQAVSPAAHVPPAVPVG